MCAFNFDIAKKKNETEITKTHKNDIIIFVTILPRQRPLVVSILLMLKEGLFLSCRQYIMARGLQQHQK